MTGRYFFFVALAGPVIAVLYLFFFAPDAVGFSARGDILLFAPLNALFIGLPHLVWWAVTRKKKSLLIGGVVGADLAVLLILISGATQHNHQNGMEWMIYYPLCLVLLLVGGSIGYLIRRRANKSATANALHLT
jgi:hypothetical protein